MVALLATYRGRRIRFCIGLLFGEAVPAPARPSLPPPTFTAAAESVEPASGPGIVSARPALRLVKGRAA